MNGPVTRLSALFVGFTLLAATEALAQACIGVPIADGSFAVEGLFGTTEGSKSYGGNVTANLTGPVSLQAGYMLTDIDDIDENGNTFGANLAYELANAKVSLCPVIGVSYSTFSTELLGEEFDISEVVVPVGSASARPLRPARASG